MPNLAIPYICGKWGRGNSTVVHCAIDLLPPLPTTGSKKAVNVLLCLCNNACKRSLHQSPLYRVGKNNCTNWSYIQNH